MSACVGIVAEYNPLHNGHRLMMEAARSRLGDVPCVVVLSSNFTQRGEPALCDKWTRARMALSCGADLVLELPFPFACAAAPDFSAGAVDLLARTRLATHIAFGMEDPDRDLDPILNILAREPPDFKQHLQEALGRGASYPRAVASALDALIPGGGAFVSSPNNLLALSYLLRVRRQGYPLSPLPLPRRGAAHDERTAFGPLASSGAIRAALGEGASLEEGGPLSAAVPGFTFFLLREAERAGRLCVSYNEKNKTYWGLLQALLLRSTPEELQHIDGMDEGIENRFLRHWRDAADLEDFVGRCVCARYTRGHIRRLIVRLLLGLDRWTARALRRCGAPYARVLGFSARGRGILREGKASDLPFITRLSAAKGPIGRRTAQLEFRASALYELLLPRPDPHREERGRPEGTA